MPQYKARSATVEVNGETVLAIVDGMGSSKGMALKVLEENGLKDPKPGSWYSQQGWLNSFKAIADKIGPATLFQIGKRIPENAVFPPGIDTIDKAMAGIDMAYHMNHRGGDIGVYAYSSTGETTGKMVCDNPYPCDFDRGIVEAMAKRFKPETSIGMKVIHDDSCPCRKNGAESCTYQISWDSGRFCP